MRRNYGADYSWSTNTTSVTFENKCTRCGRTDLIIRTNGLCARCDDALYGSRSQPFPYPIPYPIYPEPYEPLKVTWECVQKGADDVVFSC